MIKRYRPAIAATDRPSGDYFPTRKSTLTFLSSGCTLLDCVLGGGWPLGRVSNIVGDKSSGKTLLAIEACVNFARQFPKGKIWYREVEAAFDLGYAEELGLPLDRVDFGPEGGDTQWETIEDIFEDIEAVLKTKPKEGLYIIDSLDALSSRAELARKLDEGTYGLEKQKALGQLFRRLIRRLRDSNIHVMIISQVRDKIGVMFGDKHTRTGGRALDFYASLIVYLTHMKTINRTIRGVKRPVAIRVKVKCTKNKITIPMREAEFTLRFGYGVDDLVACLDWLEDVKMLGEIGVSPAGVDRYIVETEGLPQEEYRERILTIKSAVRKCWADIENDFRPKRRKY